jgi:hypothetical protein
MDAARCDWSDLFAFFMFECEAVDEADAYSKNHTSQRGGSREVAMTMRTRWSAVPAVAYKSPDVQLKLTMFSTGRKRYITAA